MGVMSSGRIPSNRLIWAVGLFIIAAVLPLLPGFSSRDNVEMLIAMAMGAFLAVSWNIIGGMGGQLSFGHAIFFGCGGYLSSAFFLNLGWNPLIGGAVGIVAAVVIALGMGYLGFRYELSHLRFALATAALSEVFLFFVMGTAFLGGAFGLALPYNASPAELFFRFTPAYYWIFLGLLIVALLVTIWVRRRKLGLYLVGIRENEKSAAALGVNVLRTKLFAIAISAALTSAGGVVYANYLRFVEPADMLGFDRALAIVIPAMLGGTGTIIGPVVGAIIYTLILTHTRSLFEFAGSAQLFVGIILGVIVLIMPQGIVPRVAEAWAKLQKRRRGKGQGTTSTWGSVTETVARTSAKGVAK